MRNLIFALCLLFALGGFAAAPAFAHCSLHEGKVATDFETPPPAAPEQTKDET